MLPVHDTVLSPDWDTLLYAVPVLVMLMAGVFHLDELLMAPRQGSRVRQPPARVDENGQPLLFDPDGRPSRPERSNK
jgi:hypothetical protein